MAKLTREQIAALADLLTRDQVAKAFHYHPDTLKRWELNGLGPDHVRLGNIVAYRQEDVETWVRNRLERAAKELSLVYERAFRNKPNMKKPGSD